MKKRIVSVIKNRIQPEGGIKNFVENKDSVIYPSEKAKKGYSVPALVMEYGSGMPKFKLKTFFTILSTYKSARKSYKEVINNPKNPKTKITGEFTEDLVRYAKSIGALNIGFTKVDPKHIFKDSTILYENAIVVTMEMEKEAIEKAPSKDTGHEVHKTYNKLGSIVNKIAERLRKNGYSAQAGPALGGDVNYVVLAEKAGLGAIGNHGLLISPKVGPRQRIAAVYTNIENLPIKEQINKHKWVKDFCRKCKKCVCKCPTQAIFKEPQDDIYDSKKHIDNKKCAEIFGNTSGCSICIKECIFNIGDYEKIKSCFNN